MPVHDWTRVDAETFHDFHTRWITHLSEALNGGVLPPGYYAMAEQWAGRAVADVLTLEAPSAPRALRRTLTIRHVSGHRVVAVVEIVSPGNKDRAVHVAEFADKAEAALSYGIHLLLVDLIPPGPHDPQGMHATLWERFDDEPYVLPSNEPLTLASYVAGPRPEASLEHLAVGSPLAEMPLFLEPERYVNTPLEPSYLAAYRGMPTFWRDVLEGKGPLPQ
jgi:hypothetical protein